MAMLWRLVLAAAARPALGPACLARAALRPTHRVASFMHVAAAPDDRFSGLRELITQRRIGAAVSELETLLDEGVSPPAVLLAGLMRCAGAAGELRAERKAYRLCKTAVEADAASAGAADESTRVVEEGHALALAEAGDISNGAFILLRYVATTGAPRISRATLSQFCALVTSIAKEFASSRPLRRALRQMGGATQIGGCLCCQPGTSGARARAEAARAAAWLVAHAAEPRGMTADSQAADADADAAEAGAVASMLEAAGATPRFGVGEAVEVRAKGGKWQKATVEHLWWREPEWDADAPVAPYRVRLAAGGDLIYCAEDSDAVIREARFFDSNVIS